MEVCYGNIKATVNLLQELAFTIHPKKSVLLLTKKYMLFGFVLDSTIMTIQLTGERKHTICSHCEIKVKLDLLSDIDISLMVEKSIRRGICHTIH